MYAYISRIDVFPLKKKKKSEKNQPTSHAISESCAKVKKKKEYHKNGHLCLGDICGISRKNKQTENPNKLLKFLCKEANISSITYCKFTAS